MRKSNFSIIKCELSVLLACIFFASCASTSPLNKVYVTNSNKVDLLPTAAISREIDEYQYFDGEFGGNSFSALLYLQADKNEINILLLNDFGIEAGSIFYDGKTAHLESDFFPKNLKCEYIILDLQNAYADFAALKSHYKKYKIDFEESSAPEKTVRKIIKNSKVIEEIGIEKDKITIENYLRNYKYVLTKAEP